MVTTDDTTKAARSKPAVKSRWRKLLWFVGLWALGVAAAFAVSYAIRLAIMPA